MVEVVEESLCWHLRPFTVVASGFDFGEGRRAFLGDPHAVAVFELELRAMLDSQGYVMGSHWTEEGLRSL